MLAARCPACGRTSANVVSAEHLDIPFYSDREIDVVERVFPAELGIGALVEALGAGELEPVPAGWPPDRIGPPAPGIERAAVLGHTDLRVMGVRPGRHARYRRARLLPSCSTIAARLERLLGRRAPAGPQSAWRA